MNHFPSLPETLQPGFFALVRWLHIVFTTLLVGGTLFYEFVIPKAIEDLKEESQLAVLGRVRWFFRGIVIFSSVFLIASGALSVWYFQNRYTGIFQTVQPWLVMHIGLGLLALVLSIAAMARTRSPRIPLTWLRVNFVILLVGMFIGSVARHIHIAVQENIEHENEAVFKKYHDLDRQ